MKYKKALILIAHGSRVTSTQEEMTAMVQKIGASLPDTLVLGAYMELQEPNLEQTIEMVIAQETMRVDILPLFVFKGRHIRDDIPAQVEDCQKRFPTCNIVLQRYIGSSEFFVKAIADSVDTF